MVDIQSKEVIDKISEELKVQPSLQIPRELAKNIQLVFDVNTERFVDVVAAEIRTTTTTGIIFTTPTNRDFFLTSMNVAITKDGSNDNVITTIEITPKGKAAVTVLAILSETLTAMSDHSFQNYAPPIKLERGSQIRLIGGFTVGTMTKQAVITGFTTDPL